MPRSGDVLSHNEMCSLEGRMLQQGMNYLPFCDHSVVLMSQRKNAPYPDRLSEDGRELYYIGHDAYGHSNKTRIDQPLARENGKLTQNGLFFKAVQELKQGAKPRRVHVYEKIKEGMWVFNGLFLLVNARQEHDGIRKVWVFQLHLEEETIGMDLGASSASVSIGRLIPRHVKVAVFKRDRGRCVLCGSRENLHFDHVIPFSKGGSSTDPRNIQLLCQKHNLAKSDRIE